MLLPVPEEEVRPFDPPPVYAELRKGPQVVRVACPTGIDAWLVSDYAGVREVLGDGRRFSTRPGQAAHVLSGFGAGDGEPVEGSFAQTDGPEHIRIRRNFAPQVSHARRLAELRPMVERITDEAITRMLASPQPYLLHSQFSTAITTAVIAELIGVPPDRHHLLHDAATALFTTSTKPGELRTALEPLWRYLYELIATRRARPGDDVLSRMIELSADSDRPLTDAELTAMNGALLIAGFDTTASMITYGLVCLWNTPGQWERLCAEPGLAVTATEELVRYLAAGTGLLRQAVEDTQVHGQPIRAGDYVVVALQSGNRDPGLHADGDTFDVARKPGPHLGFGHGAHACVGQQIARLELTAVLRALARRVPALHPAVPLEQLEWKKDSVVRGPVELPVRWS
ncbi:cytochrome P450 [Paractinoplanes abujensis]|uniref:Cytochrome P450 n=1 Tax=Paractinoplanes abujensis TaxID=882441 RepID=A0A7W7CPP7_9ACTN|nr:cytochrome P450 [Actinoplanes abujensis]MBB4692398.1 cytochrome P450 [Actinoplanes abujensis]GID24125.1 cytochrome P450 [Actinoplanes abujensis]